ncbi:hypothetical protein QEV83_04985 [Methylocapsa sp. D3K7]|nr:hypothetical protein [Methylocapsa sp. D3K7]WGJ15626.1 hypothetical protein QEV83_04985 [Methylocapsa sp. D3K7]
MANKQILARSHHPKQNVSNLLAAYSSTVAFYKGLVGVRLTALPKVKLS